MLVVVLLLIAVAFVGGILTVCKAGEKDGICKYGEVDE